MPAKRLSRTSAILAALVATTGLAFAGATPAAATECGERSTTQAFAAFGDTNDYFPVRNGDFESGTLTGWTGSGISTVSGNEPWQVLGSGHATSARLAPRGVMYSEFFCVQLGEDSVRLFVNRPGVAGATLNIVATVRSSDGRKAATLVKVDGSVPGWTASPRVPLQNVYDVTGRQIVDITIQATGTAAPWGVDDVMVDPWRTR